MMKVGIKSNKILGETCNLIMADQITNADAVTQVLHVMARFQYTPSLKADFSNENGPDALFMKKCTQILKNEPILSQSSACINFWNFYAMSFEDKDLLNCLSQYIIKDHQNLIEKDVVKVFKSMAHFDYLNLEARDALLKTTIRNS